MAAIKLVYSNGASLVYRGHFSAVELLQSISKAAPDSAVCVNNIGQSGIESAVFLSCCNLMAAFEVEDTADHARGIETTHVGGPPVIVENHVLAPLRRIEGSVERDEAGRLLRTVQVESILAPNVA